MNGHYARTPESWTCESPAIASNCSYSLSFVLFTVVPTVAGSLRALTP